MPRKPKPTPHTPGPWAVSYSPSDGYTIWHDPRVRGDLRRGAVVVAGEFRAGDEARSNAVLCSAAPDLLAVARAYDHEMTAVWGSPERMAPGNPAAERLWAAARAAVAKAEA